MKTRNMMIAMAFAVAGLAGCATDDTVGHGSGVNPAPQKICLTSVHDAWAAAEPQVVATGAVIARAAALRAYAQVDDHIKATNPAAAYAVANEAAATAFAELDPCTLQATPEGIALLPTDMSPEYQPKSWGGTFCRAGCWTAAAVGCATVSVFCAVDTFFTFGGTSIPCGWAIIAACGASAGGASICADVLCPP